MMFVDILFGCLYVGLFTDMFVIGIACSASMLNLRVHLLILVVQAGNS